MKFVLTGGGTAGHINPALGIAQRLKELLPDAQFLFIGAEGMMETELVPREGYPLRTIAISGLSRSLSLNGLKHNAVTLRQVLRSTGTAKRILREFCPDAVVGTGGYVCYPVLRAAHALGLPTLVHEANAVPGLTTKLLSRFVDCVMVGFEHARENYSASVRVEFTGMPVREDFSGLTRAAARRKLGLDDDTPLLLSVWGSLGSGHVNGLMPDFLSLVCRDRRFRIIHAAGKRYYGALAEQVTARCGADASEKGVDVREYIYDMPTVMAAADLVMCRSGASTLGELAALGKPAILVPSPNVTNNQQEKNARPLEKLGGARVLTEGGFTAESLYGAALELLSSPETLEKMGAAMRSCGVPDAAGRIADLILDCVKE